MVESPTRQKSTRTAGQRKCLKCGCKFNSKSRIHRLCEPCKGENKSIADIQIEIPHQLWKRLGFHNYHLGGV